MTANEGIGDSVYYNKYYKERTWEFYRFLLLDLIQYGRPGKILDLGSGCGFFIEAARAWGMDCTGVEGSPDAIRIMKQRNPTLEAFCQPLSEKLPFEARTFTVVVINEVIEHLERHVQVNALKEANRVLKTGGILLVNSPSKYNNEQKADPTHINMLSPLELRDLLIGSGFHKLVDKNSPLYLTNRFRYLDSFIVKFFRLTKIEKMSATASYIATKK